MASFLLSYDLNGPNPSHKEMDNLIRSISVRAGRVLETVWWVEYHGTVDQLRDRLLSIVRNEDRLFVCACRDAAWFNLLVGSGSLKQAIEAA